MRQPAAVLIVLVTALGLTGACSGPRQMGHDGPVEGPIFDLTKPVAKDGECEIIAATLRHPPLALSVERLRTRLGKGEAPPVTANYPGLSDGDLQDLAGGTVSRKDRPYALRCHWKRLGFTGRPDMKPGAAYVYVGRPVIGSSGNLATIGVSRIGPRAKGDGPNSGEGHVCLLRRTLAGWAISSCHPTWAL
jgi:hypothetical protein